MSERLLKNLIEIGFHDGELLGVRIDACNQITLDARVCLFYSTPSEEWDDFYEGTVRLRVDGIERMEYSQCDPPCSALDGLVAIPVVGEPDDSLLKLLQGQAISRLKVEFQWVGVYLELEAKFASLELVQRGSFVQKLPRS